MLQDWSPAYDRGRSPAPVLQSPDETNPDRPAQR